MGNYGKLWETINGGFAWENSLIADFPAFHV